MINEIDTVLKKKLAALKECFINWFDGDKKVALITGIIVGIITHILMITGTIMSQDGLWNSMKYAKPGDWEITLGRWGIILAEKLNFYIAIPSVATISCIVFMAIASAFVVDLFKFKKKSMIVLTSAALVVSPAFTVTLLYIYTALAYSLNFLLSILTVWFIYRFNHKKIGMILAALCFVLSLGIYQSYMGVTIGLCIMLEVLDLLNGEKNYKESFLNLVKAAVLVVIAATAYYMFTNFILAIKKLELSSYKGANDSNIYTIIMGLKNTIFMTYRDFVYFFFGDRIIYNRPYRRNTAYSLLFVMTAFFGMLRLIKMWKNDETKKDKLLKTLLILFLLVCLPLGLNIIDVIVINTEIYALTAAQLILIIPFCLAIVDGVEELEILKLFTSFCVFFIVFSYYVSANVSYTVEKMTYNQAYAVTSRVMGRIESLEGYNKDLPIMIAGIVGNDNYPRTNKLYDYSICDITKNTVFHFTYGGMVETWRNYISVFFGVEPLMCDDNTYYQISQGADFKSMGVYPARDSVKIIDGIVVVKFHEDPPLPQN